MSWAPRFMWSWPSWIVELLSGLILVGGIALAVALCRYWWGILVVATVLSALYENYVDANGWDLDDIEQRTLGILFGIVLLMWLRS
jgi:hypothetical protein